MIGFDSVKKKLLQDPEVVREYEAHKTEFEIARALVRARLSAKMTQLDVARNMQTSQSQIARLESGHHLPSLSTIKRYATAIDQHIKIDVSP